MAPDTPEDIIGALDDLMDRERAALLAGDLDALAPMLQAKEQLAGRIHAHGGLEPGVLSRFQTKVTRNQALLSSAMDGIRAVAGRIAVLRRVRDGLDIYDNRGRKSQFPNQSQPNVEKRA